MMAVSLRFLSLALLASSVFVLTDCSKSNEPAPATQPSRTELLTGHNWRLTAAQAVITDNGVTTTTDVYARLPACSLDNFTKFNADFSYVQDSGVTKCTSTDPQILVTSTWAFLANETQFSLSPNSAGSYTYIYTINTLTATTLSIETIVTRSGGTEDYTFTYTAI